MPVPLLTVRHIYEISEMTTRERRTIVMRPRSLMDFSLRCVRFYPGVNSRAELVTLAPGLRPERRFAQLARGQGISFIWFKNKYWRTGHFSFIPPIFRYNKAKNHHKHRE